MFRTCNTNELAPACYTGSPESPWAALWRWATDCVAFWLKPDSVFGLFALNDA